MTVDRAAPREAGARLVTRMRAIADGEESALRALRNDARRVAARFPAEPWRDFLATLATALDTPTRVGTGQG